MYEFTDCDGDAFEVPIEEVTLQFVDPHTGVFVTVPIVQIVKGSLQSDLVNQHPFVYDKDTGYISIRGEINSFTKKLEASQREMIEDILDIKDDGLEIENAATVEAEEAGILGFYARK